MLDSYKHGQDLSNATESTIHNILEFSYTSLIEALPQSAYIMLEALFLLGKPSSRGQVRYLTELSADAMAEAIRSLSNTSLIIRRSVKSHENLELNGSVHELLSNHNKDPRTRQKINARLVKQQTAVQQEGMYPFHPLSVPGEIESWARGVVNELSEAFTRDASANERHQAISRIRENKQQPKYPACFDRIEGILLLQESQGVEAVKAFHKALSKDPNDVAAKMGLSEAQLSLNQLESGLETAHQLISTWHEKWDELKRHTKRRLFGNAWQHYAEFYTPEKLFNSLLEIGCFTDVDDIHISVRLRALEKRFDGQRMSISDETRWLQRAKQCFEDWKDFRYMSGLNTDALRLLRRFKRNSELIRIHAQGIAIANPGNPLIKKKLREQIQYWRTELADNPSNPLSGTEWEDPDLGQLSPTEKMLSRSGYVPVEITSPCKTDRNALQYFFGEGNDRQRFFLHSGTATEMSNEEFGGLSRGDRVWVKPGDQLNSKNTPASHIVKL
jgi:tetratricopeptide (TPR) repeat protein